MLTEQEQERLQAIHDSVGVVIDTLKDSFGEEVMPDAGLELVAGTMLAAVDAVFAIREGQPWRGLTDPQEIARKLLREAHLGE